MIERTIGNNLNTHKNLYHHIPMLLDAHQIKFEEYHNMYQLKCRPKEGRTRELREVGKADSCHHSVPRLEGFWISTTFAQLRYKHV